MKHVLTHQQKLDAERADMSPGQIVGDKLNKVSIKQPAELVENQIDSKKIKTIDDVQMHPACVMLPPMGDNEWSRFKADVKANGFNLQQAIYFDEQGRLIDGRHRLRALLELYKEGWRGAWPTFETLYGDDEAITRRVLSDNLHRRHLSESQRAAIASELANNKRGGDRKSSDQTVNLRFATKVADAAEVLGVSESLVTKYRAAIKKYPEMEDSIKLGHFSVNEVLNGDHIKKVPAKGGPAKRTRKPARPPEELALEHLNKAMKKVAEMDESSAKTEMESTIKQLIESLSKGLPQEA